MSDAAKASVGVSGSAARSIRGVGAFSVAYLGVAAAAAAWTGNAEFVFYLVVMIVLFAGVYAVHRRVNLTYGALWALSFWGLLHMLGGLCPVPESWPINGDVRVLYSLWFVPGLLKYDHVVHAYGFGVTTWVCWQALGSALATEGRRLEPTAGLMILCAAAGLGFGALNEVVEFAATLLIPETNVGGYLNTGWDLVSNTVGAAIAAVAIFAMDGRNQDA